jgi:hypothetical protein
MKKIIVILSLIAETSTGGPFTFGKYIPYDNRILFQSNQTLNIYNNSWATNPPAQTNNYNTGNASVFIKFNCTSNGRLKKPFIFVEGLSFEKQNQPAQMFTLSGYTEFLLESKAQSIRTLKDIILNSTGPDNHSSEIGYSNFNWATLVTGVDAMGLGSNRPQDAMRVEKLPSLLNQLYDNGFDIVYVDFHIGQNYIEHHASCLKQALEYIHEELVEHGSNEKMVVCGASMGGLVSRFAIRALELEGKMGWVSKFISFDSPQLGANINIGLQALMRDMPHSINSVEETYNKITSPAALQMLKASIKKPFWTNPHLAGPAPERTTFLSRPEMSTWPTSCKLIAITNGSRTGTLQNDGTSYPGDDLMRAGNPAGLSIRALRENSLGWILDYDQTLLACVPEFGIIGDPRNLMYSPISYDVIAGSYRNDLFAANDQWLSLPWFNISGICSWILQPQDYAKKYCFIPTYSAAGLKTFESNYTGASSSEYQTNDLFRGQSRIWDPFHTISYFDVVYAPNQNQSHVEITDQNIGWLMEEVVGKPELLFQKELVFNGDYRASGHIKAGNFVAKYGPSCTVTEAVANSVTNIAGPYGSETMINVCGPVVVPNNGNVEFVSQYSISLEPGFETQSGAQFIARIEQVEPCPGRYSANDASDEQGSAWLEAYLNSFQESKRVKPKPYSPELMFSISPNPADQTITISGIKPTQNPMRYQIINILGTTVLEESFGNSDQNLPEVRIETANLPNGTYVLRVSDGQEAKTQKVIIQH